MRYPAGGREAWFWLGRGQVSHGRRLDSLRRRTRENGGESLLDDCGLHRVYIRRYFLDYIEVSIRNEMKKDRNERRLTRSVGQRAEQCIVL